MPTSSGFHNAAGLRTAALQATVPSERTDPARQLSGNPTPPPEDPYRTFGPPCFPGEAGAHGRGRRPSWAVRVRAPTGAAHSRPQRFTGRLAHAQPVELLLGSQTRRTIRRTMRSPAELGLSLHELLSQSASWSATAEPRSGPRIPSDTVASSSATSTEWHLEQPAPENASCPSCCARCTSPSKKTATPRMSVRGDWDQPDDGSMGRLWVRFRLPQPVCEDGDAHHQEREGRLENGTSQHSHQRADARGGCARERLPPTTMIASNKAPAARSNGRRRSPSLATSLMPAPKQGPAARRPRREDLLWDVSAKKRSSNAGAES